MLALTDRRLILYDHAFLGTGAAMVSIPYSRVSAIAWKDPGSGEFASDTLHVNTTGGRSYALHFASKEKAHRAHTLIMKQVLRGEIPD